MEEEIIPTSKSQQQYESITLSRLRREIQKLAWFADIVTYALSTVDLEIPISFIEAFNCCTHGKW